MTLRWWIVLLALAAALPGCNRHRKIEVQATEEEAGSSLVSTVHVADEKSSQQLLKGWHSVEQNAWRWTMRNFSVLLSPPRNSAHKGALLQMKMAVPDPVIAALKSVTLSAKVNGVPLPPETFTSPGEYTFSRDVPTNALQGETVEVLFSLDKAMAPSANDERELGVVVSMVGLESK